MNYYFSFISFITTKHLVNCITSAAKKMKNERNMKSYSFNDFKSLQKGHKIKDGSNLKCVTLHIK